jgi:hypothetical protein
MTPFLEYGELKCRADEFLRNHHPSRTIPVPIEDIIERVMKIEIFPTPNLRSTADVVALTSSDMTRIRVDQYMMEEWENRYRFSLAHEAGHVTLHPEWIKATKVTSIKDWQSYFETIDGQEYARIEIQANHFAGLVLAPTEHLRRLWFEEVKKVPPELRRDVLLKQVYEHVGLSIASEFEMSSESVGIRLSLEGLGWSDNE